MSINLHGSLNVVLLLTIIISLLVVKSCTGSSENEADTITKIGQGVGHTMNIFYWYVHQQ